MLGINPYGGFLSASSNSSANKKESVYLFIIVFIIFHSNIFENCKMSSYEALIFSYVLISRSDNILDNFTRLLLNGPLESH